MSLFITFEGGEGSGKSTQARALYRRLVRLDIAAVLTYEPGGTRLSKQIGRWLKTFPDLDIRPLTELLLFNASRAQLVDEVIHPALKGGEIVICDRFTDSTTAYQGYGRGLDLETVAAINRAAAQGISPDLTFLLDLPVEAGLGRQQHKPDRFEQEDIAFHRRVREGYLKLAANDPRRWLVIDACQPKEKIEEIIWQRVKRLISEQSSKDE